MFGDGEGWKTVAFDTRQVVMEGGRTFMATWKEERAAEVRRNKKEAEEADKTPIALRCFRAALIGSHPPHGRAVSTMSPH